MLLLIRLRVPTSLTLRVPRPSVLSSTFLRPVCLRTFATESVPEDYKTTTSSRREGHISHCPHPLKFIACGAERHLRKDFPHPGAERIKAMYAQPKKCFRCGGTHVIKECTQPAKCWFCGWTGHKRSDCPHAAEGGGGGIAVQAARPLQNLKIKTLRSALCFAESPCYPNQKWCTSAKDFKQHTNSCPSGLFLLKLVFPSLPPYPPTDLLKVNAPPN
ncbi:hypothetical protein B0H13DRAFT_1853646 [Mycena leptocephala]|nr:hypothetical protein B0H13DRAFT_1853646 [Mycena leptocephala]